MSFERKISTFFLSVNAMRTHAKAKVKLLPGKKRIACIGDSITYGAGVENNRENEAWPFLLEKLLGDAYQVLNYGVSGATAQPDGDFPYRRFGFLRQAFQSEAETVLLMLGTNDSKPYNWDPDGYRRAMNVLVAAIQASLPSARLFIVLPPRAFEVDGVINFDIQNTVIQDEVLPILQKLSMEKQLPVIDLYQLTENNPEYFDDGIHPNALGNEKIAEYIHSYFKEELFL